ncbi:ALK and LTK ligand 1 [Pseudophryne corroboree]|uniref:ALK and LTK ligand 1 n=1 Tax=Pseudophryne corroboree TaxID=495146 RepID=UPI0030819C2D
MCDSCFALFPRSTEGEMLRKWQAVLAIAFLLVTSSVQGISELHSGERRTLLDLLVQVIGDSSASRESERVITRRYSEGAAYSAEPAAFTRTNSKRPSELFSRDSNLKEKFINHFTAGPAIYSTECSKQVHRLYHNTKDCTTPALYKRCAKLLTRLFRNRVCSQP